jgi:phage terminase large subunit-like protein
VLHPADWARLAVKLYNFFRASCIVAEANQGGELIREIIKGVSSGIPVRLVHASMGKRPRAEPVALLYEQGRVKHCGEFRELEDQMLTWDASDPSARSPNDIDALVWAFHGLELCDATVSRVTKRVQSAR